MPATADPPLQPIMHKPGQTQIPGRTVSPLRLHTPKFADVSPNHPSSANGDRTSYFSPTSPGPTTPSGILLNKLKLDGADTPPPESPTDENGPVVTDAATVSPLAPVAPGSLGFGLGVGLARVGSPDGSASETSAAASSEGWASSGGGGNTSTAPSSAVGSPTVKPRARSPTDSLATLTLLGAKDMPAGTAETVLDEGAGLSRSPSPHCHFAPLPNVDQERPPTRRNSSAAQSQAQKFKMSAADAPDEPFALEMDEKSPPSSDMTGLSALSFAQGVPPPRQLSFSRSSSPSPSRRSSSAQSSSRSHSPPPMARKGSNDALHLHYIVADGTRRSASATGARSRDGSLDRSEEGGSRSGSRRGTFSEVGGRCKPIVRSRSTEGGPTNEDVVEVPPSDGGDDVDEVIDEESDEEEEEAEDDEDDPQDERDGSDEDEDEDEEEAAEEQEEHDEAKASKTVRGAAVEVVHWHKHEDDHSREREIAPPTPTAVAAH